MLKCGESKMYIAVIIPLKFKRQQNAKDVLGVTNK